MTLQLLDSRENIDTTLKRQGKQKKDVTPYRLCGWYATVGQIGACRSHLKGFLRRGRQITGFWGGWYFGLLDGYLKF